MHTVALCITLLYAAGLGQNAVLFEHPDSLGHNISTFRRNTPATSQQMPLQDLHTPLKPHHACDKHSGFKRQAPSETTPDNLSPTPAPTGDSSPSTTVHITDEHDFTLLLPNRPGGRWHSKSLRRVLTRLTRAELISDAENDGVAFCTPASSSCPQRMQDGFIRAAAVAHADDGSWVQVRLLHWLGGSLRFRLQVPTGCLQRFKKVLTHLFELPLHLLLCLPFLARHITPNYANSRVC
ncbi:hypothetical protein A0H81_14428 [Grifola frondosa]|uniref:Uncharacterized protein n=1 Tax=Grifola frondosa TaxID=5627 RepID=A0A1C7LNS5_GRIFR|nr:hypothetical protein A0H81_14428 [Grifola frondosa]